MNSTNIHMRSKIFEKLFPSCLCVREGIVCLQIPGSTVPQPNLAKTDAAKTLLDSKLIGKLSVSFVSNVSKIASGVFLPFAEFPSIPI